MKLQKKADRIEECFDEIIKILEEDFDGTRGSLEHAVWKLSKWREIIKEHVNNVLKYESPDNPRTSRK